MTRSTPKIHSNTLLLHEEQQILSIVVGSAQWFEWLGKATSTTFSYYSSHGSYTARKEQVGNHRGGWYWKAYRKSQGTLYRAYLGKAEDLTMERLDEIARTLARRIHGQYAASSDFSEVELQPASQKNSITAVTPLLSTKLHPPRLPALLVDRFRLLRLLDGRQKLILIRTPAGFGKTTLMTQWIAYRERQATHLANIQRHPSPVAWLSLDSSDNDLIRFWSALIAACQVYRAHLGQKTLEHLSQVARSPCSSSSLETALTFLLNDLEHTGSPGVIILEDYHTIEHPRIHETLTFFIEHLPASLQIVLLTRSTPSLPLVRWRASGDLLEISSSQLRFDALETITFFQQVLPQTITQEAMVTLSSPLEGWAAGLRLLVLSVQNQVTEQTIKSVLTSLPEGATSHAHQSIQEYFLSEILAAQPEALQFFLLQTSILCRLAASLCDAVTGRQDSADWLIVVERSGCFLEAMDSTWYRYHALFAESMRVEASRRLGEEALRNLWARASRWYAEHALPVEAIDAALAAQQFEQAAHLIEQLNETSSFSEYHTMCRWMQWLPAALLPAHPTLCFLFARAQFFAEDHRGLPWNLEPVEDLLQAAEEGWRKCGNLHQVGVLYAFRATFTVVHGLLAPATAFAQQALQLLPSLTSGPTERSLALRPAEWIEWYCGSLLALGLEAMQEGVFDKAHHILLEAYIASMKHAERVFTRIVGRLLGEVCIELGELHQAASYYQQTLAEPPWQDERGESLFRVQVACGLIRLAYERNELETAERLLQEASLHTYSGNFPHGEEDAHVKLALLKILLLYARGKVADAQAALSPLFVRLQAFTIPGMLPLVPDMLIWQARLQIADTDLVGASRTIDMLNGYTLSPLQQEALRLLSARLSFAMGETDSALSGLLQLLPLCERGRHVTRVLEIRLLLALTYAARKQEQEAQKQLVLALAQARTAGLMRIFLNEGEPLATLLHSLLPTLSEKPLRAYARHLLHAFVTSFPVSSISRNVTREAFLEPLSPQEQRVLTLLVAGRSNPEIAAALIVSVNTVKGHIKNLYRKLSVTNRQEASEVARSAQLIPE
ncbi:LuxR C-terminal-related transcriptional regulator [Dictyobacter arantiisoli]|uniref:HTH luxR-type domain-containing protein n=1 Tax=Dictyobacter arantiisoli TaxID=2014874 RepID=A0A5A5TK76_9CHLR|nr:LuxR C-terminal-related transcriptional regulator [Dictyobacter arantiisoli]GCF11294.1 hypothetical protein KDI_48580 [Dictyobacter arantiisoli]